MAAKQLFLIDNGSLRPAATYALRALAKALSERLDQEVQPVSLLHSHKIPTNAIDGGPATIVRRALKKGIQAGVTDFVFIPLFLGPSLAVTDYIQTLITEGKELVSNLNVTVADTLCGQSVDNPDPRLAQILTDLVENTMQKEGWTSPQVALVDHGTPIEIVNRLRNAVAKQLKLKLEAQVELVKAASMERRDGPEYAFNEPLLEGLEAVESRQLIVSMFFLLPGRHAGPGGDVIDICQRLVDDGKFDQVKPTALLGEHSALLDILTDRALDALNYKAQP